MALSLTGGTTNKLNCGSASSLDNLTTLTYLLWVNPHASLGVNDALIHKQGTQSKTLETQWGSAGILGFYVVWSTESDEAESGSGFITTGAWQLLGVTYDHSISGQRIRLYRGTLSAAVSESASYGWEYHAASGTHSDAAGDLIVGNRASGNYSWYGSIAWAGIWNRVLTLAEMQEQQFNPHVTSGCVLFTHLGYNGTGTQPDWSGNGNNGTVTSATVSDHVPLGPMLRGMRRSGYVVSAAVGQPTTKRYIGWRPQPIASARVW